MIHIKNNTCNSCQKTNLNWSLNYAKTDMEIFRCGHGLCKKCFSEIKNNFECPICKDTGQLHTAPDPEYTKTWISIAEWYNEYQIYIESGCATNILKHTKFGQQLLRLLRENKEEKNLSKKPKSSKRLKNLLNVIK